MALQKPFQQVDEAANGIAAPGHAPVGGEQQAVVVIVDHGHAAGQQHEVLDVVGHDGPPFLRHPPEELLVAEANEIGAFNQRDEVMTLFSELSGKLGRVMLVEEQSHASASPRRCQRASSRSAIARARSIHSSISSR
jgi:hypothetical protein